MVIKLLFKWGVAKGEFALEKQQGRKIAVGTISNNKLLSVSILMQIVAKIKVNSATNYCELN